MVAFTDRLLGDAAGFVQVVMASIGDRLGIWRDLAASGPATSKQLARRMGLSERHVREWLSAMAAARYLDYDADAELFSLPDDRARVLADERSPEFLGGVQQLLVSYLKPYDRLVDTFRTGGGIPQSAYSDATFHGQERFSATRYEHQLAQSWLPAAGLDVRLEAGTDVCDVGCGGGIALVTLAQRYPRSRFVGYDVFGPSVHRARARAAQLGLSERVTFHQLDAAAGIPQRFDVITTFDVVHDAVDPEMLLSAIRRALAPGGSYLCLEMNCGARLEDNLGPTGALMHGISVMYCMTTSLAHGGAALGTCGAHEGLLRELSHRAGFDRLDKLPVGDAFNNLYLLV
jgi:2-polyprenyl-3-methyl-5-hydroxy-6-metoxy-1,4-benzoquinol methylase